MNLDKAHLVLIGACGTLCGFIKCPIRLFNVVQFTRITRIGAGGELQRHGVTILHHCPRHGWALNGWMMEVAEVCARFRRAGDGDQKPPFTLNHWARCKTLFTAPSVLKVAGHLGQRYVLCLLVSCYSKLLSSARSRGRGGVHERLGVLQLL